ncbi:MAG: hypothetical protein FWH04_04415 [Oscillospiraceae bacterium]|nr:hypothetical protein [Oscillospiraceae bacterium]
MNIEELQKDMCTRPNVYVFPVKLENILIFESGFLVATGEWSQPCSKVEFKSINRVFSVYSGYWIAQWYTDNIDCNYKLDDAQIFEILQSITKSEDEAIKLYFSLCKNFFDEFRAKKSEYWDKLALKICGVWSIPISQCEDDITSNNIEETLNQMMMRPKMYPMEIASFYYMIRGELCGRGAFPPVLVPDFQSVDSVFASFFDVWAIQRIAGNINCKYESKNMSLPEILLSIEKTEEKAVTMFFSLCQEFFMLFHKNQPEYWAKIAKEGWG